MKLHDFLTEYGAMVQLDKLWSKPVGSQQHLLKKSKKKKKTETKEAPKGTYFTKSGNLVRGRLTKAAKERGARETDPKDKSRSKVPPVTQTRESDFDYASGKPKPDKNTTWKKFLIYKYKFSKDTFLSINKMEDIIRRKSRKDYDAIMRLKNQFFAGDQDLKTEGKRIPRKKGQPAGSKKHSDLYTDENPKGTIHGLKFATVKDAQASVSKIRSSGKKHAHKIQAAVAMEQRAKAAGKKSAAAVYRKFINQKKKKTKKMKKENAILKGVEEGTRCWKGYKKKGMKTMFGKRVPNCVKNEDKDNVTQVNFDLDKRFKVNPTEPQKAYDAFIGDYLPFNFSNGMELNIMDEDYDPNYTVWVLNDVNGKQIDMGEKVDDLVDVLQSMTHIPIEQDVANFDENFADGKKKGKSRPGRVKRAGASCKGSVTSLRKKAKNSSGEKAKMYHWCANMKSVRKKK